MADRRYNENEVAEIFREASEIQQAPTRQITPAEGMTLAELQDIAREVGISPDLVTRAAHSIGAQGVSTSRTFLGLPIGVGYTVDVGRKLSTADWDQLVSDLRQTFDARGTVRVDGSLREWSNGNLRVFVEPTPSGDRIRFKTVRAQSRIWMTGGLAMLGFSAVASLATTLSGSAHARADSLITLALLGTGMFALGAAMLPGWARQRRQQMAEVVQRLITSG